MGQVKRCGGPLGCIGRKSEDSKDDCRECLDDCNKAVAFYYLPRTKTCLWCRSWGGPRIKTAHELIEFKASYQSGDCKTRMGDKVAITIDGDAMIDTVDTDHDFGCQAYIEAIEFVDY